MSPYIKSPAASSHPQCFCPTPCASHHAQHSQPLHFGATRGVEGHPPLLLFLPLCLHRCIWHLKWPPPHAPQTICLCVEASLGWGNFYCLALGYATAFPWVNLDLRVDLWRRIRSRKRVTTASEPAHFLGACTMRLKSRYTSLANIYYGCNVLDPWCPTWGTSIPKGTC